MPRRGGKGRVVDGSGVEEEEEEEEGVQAPRRRRRITSEISSAWEASRSHLEPVKRRPLGRCVAVYRAARKGMILNRLKTHVA